MGGNSNDPDRPARGNAGDIGTSETLASDGAVAETLPSGEAMAIGETLPSGKVPAMAKTLPSGEAMAIGETLPSGEALAISETLATSGQGSATQPAAPIKIGRYKVRTTLGRGGMGVVYRARDPDLKRDVALKVLKDQDLAGDAARQRFMQEAQAMARLAHPNIVSVYDVGTHDGQIFIAMELVSGTTLREWMAKPHTWREIRDMFLATARGLEAAHAATVVHRDFKPENVLIGKDGRVCVTDFGLARSLDRDGGPDPTKTSSAPPLHDSDPVPDLTTTGEIMGTPVYMSPEQHTGEATDARTDQFSFCVALYEALYGERPFQGKTLAELRTAVTRGVIHPPASPRKVPRWLRAAILRGLHAARDERYGSMRELIAQLERDPTRTASRVAIVGGLLFVTAGASVLIASRDEDPCAGSGAAMAVAWNPQRASAVERAFVATGVPYAPDAFARVRGQLDTYAGAWSAQRLGACKDTRAQRQSQDLFDRRAMCLDHRLAAVEAFVAKLEHATPKTVESAVRASTELPALAECEDREALLARVALPPADKRKAIADVERQLAALDAREPAGDFGPLLAEAQRLVEAARALEYPPLIGAAERLHGRLLTDKGDRAAASAAYEAALASASRGRDDHLAAEVWIARLGLELSIDASSDTVAPMEQAARAAVLRVGDRSLTGSLAMAVGRHRILTNQLDAAATELTAARDAFVEAHGERSLLVARALHNIGLVNQRRGDFATAKTFLEKSLETQRAIVGAENPQLQQTESVLSTVLRALGDNAGAIELAKRTLTIREKLYGPEHGEVAASVTTLANVYYELGDAKAALAEYERALAIHTKFSGPKHADTGDAHGNVGLALVELNRIDEARKHHEAALAIAEQHGDLEAIAKALNDLSAVADYAGDLPGAVGYVRRSVEIMQKLHGPDHPLVATSQINLAGLLYSTNGLDEAADLLHAALATWERAYGREHVRLVQPLLTLGRVELARKQPRAAIEPLERALAIDAERSPVLRAESRFALARALRASGGDAKRATQLAKDALAVLADNKALGALAKHPEIAAMRTAIAAFLRAR